MQMHRDHSDHALIRETILGESVGDVASELRLIDVVDLITYVRNEQYANVGDLVSSSVERFFRPNTLRFGKAADVKLGWGMAPSVSLDMEFHHKRVSVYFRLLLEELTAGVEIDYVTFGDAHPDPRRNTERLMNAIADARLIPFSIEASERVSRIAEAHC